MPALLSELEEEGFAVPNIEKSNLKAGLELGNLANGKFTGSRDKKIFLVVDALGYNLIERIRKERKEAAKMLEKAEITKIHAVFPTTTMTGLTSIYGTMSTAEHGIVGDSLFLKDAGIMINSIKMSALLSPDELGLNTYNPSLLFPKANILNGAKEAGLRIKIAYPKQITRKRGQWTMFHEENVMPYTVFDEMIVRLRKEIEKDGCDYIIAYYDILDSLEHLHSYKSEEVLEHLTGMLASIDRNLVPLLKKKGWNLVITADHGQICVSNKERKLVDSNDRFLDFLSMPPWGGGRALFMQAREGMDAKFETYFEKNFKDFAVLMDSEEAISAGLFGKKKVDEALRYRFGTHIALAKGLHSISYVFPGEKPKDYEQLGKHGGLAKDEVEIPLLIY